MSPASSNGLEVEDIAASDGQTSSDGAIDHPEIVKKRTAGSLRNEHAKTEKRKESKGQVEEAHVVFKSLLTGKETSSMKAWFKHFDINQNLRIDHKEFQKGMALLQWPGNVESLWEEMDADGSGEITFDEVDAEQAQMWSTFRRWCGTKFSSPRDMVVKIKQLSNLSYSNEDWMNEEEFTEGLRAMGWDKGFFTSVIFEAMDIEGEGCLAARELKWLEQEVRRFKLKEEEKRKSRKMSAHKQLAKQVCQEAKRDFKAFLKQHFGGSIWRAWRRAIDLDGTMSVQRVELFKGCRKLNWRGDVRALWRALDDDGSGVTTLEELDPHCAQLLAQFKQWAEYNFGKNKPSVAMFRALDPQNKKKLACNQFIHDLEARGFDRKVCVLEKAQKSSVSTPGRWRRWEAKTLATWLDWQDKKYVTEDDVSFIDHWHPPEWLVSEPSPKAAEELKEQMLKLHGHYLKAWRKTMDKDGSNSCSWREFVDACKHLKFHGDTAGAWLALDEDLGGFITLKEIDPAAAGSLMEFKSWAEEEFGGVRSAFRVLDSDKSNNLTYREFRGAVRNYGFTGDIRLLFESLDQDGESRLDYKEVVFLDDWEITEGASAEAKQGMDLGNVAGHGEEEQDICNKMLEYHTDNPGPGAYDVVSGFACMPTNPTARHGGAWSFTLRRPFYKFRNKVGPSDYQPSMQEIRGRKPAWSIGGRKCFTVNKDPSPGPGDYQVNNTFDCGPKFTMRPRRGIVVHPAQRVCPSRCSSSTSHVRSATPATPR